MSPMRLVKSHMKLPWPSWAKRAVARLLQMVFSSISTKEWENAFDDSDFPYKLRNLLSDPRLLGHYKAFQSYIENSEPEYSFLFQNANFLNQLEYKDGRLLIEKSKGLSTKLENEFKKLSALSMQDNLDFFSKYLNALERKVERSSQDRMAFKTYFLLVLFWPIITEKEFRSLRELYNYLQPKLPPPFPIEGEDEIDTEERHYKWFEKLCQSNLGLSLKSRGRPKTKIPKVE